MDDVTQARCRRFAQWYAWAMREVSWNHDICLGVAQAVVESLDSGIEVTAAMSWARASVSDRIPDLVGRIDRRHRGYVEWYEWARREIGGDSEGLHVAASDALALLDGGHGAAEVAAMVRERHSQRTMLPAPGQEVQQYVPNIVLTPCPLCGLLDQVQRAFGIVDRGAPSDADLIEQLAPPPPPGWHPPELRVYERFGFGSLAYIAPPQAGPVIKWAFMRHAEQRAQQIMLENQRRWQQPSPAMVAYQTVLRWWMTLGYCYRCHVVFVSRSDGDTVSVGPMNAWRLCESIAAGH